MPDQSRPSVVLFDVGGVLALDAIGPVIKRLSSKYSIAAEDLNRARAKYRPLADAGEISDPEFWRLTLRECGKEGQVADWRLDNIIECVPEVLEMLLAEPSLDERPRIHARGCMALEVHLIARLPID